MKCQPDPERHRDLQQGPHGPWWCLPHHLFLLPLASVLFFHLSLLPYNCHTFPLTFPVLTLLSPTLSINTCLSVYLCTLVSCTLLKRTGDPSVPRGCERPLCVGRTAAAGADRPGGSTVLQVQLKTLTQSTPLIAYKCNLTYLLKCSNKFCVVWHSLTFLKSNTMKNNEFLMSHLFARKMLSVF